MNKQEVFHDTMERIKFLERIVEETIVEWEKSGKLVLGEKDYLEKLFLKEVPYILDADEFLPYLKDEERLKDLIYYMIEVLWDWDYYPIMEAFRSEASYQRECFEEYMKERGK